MTRRIPRFGAVIAASLCGSLALASSATACPADNGPNVTAKSQICAAWDAAPAGTLGYPLNDTHRWANGYTRDFDGGSWGRGAIMDGDAEGYAFIVGNPAPRYFWDAFLANGGAPDMGYPTGDHVFGGHLKDGPNANQYMTFQTGVINYWAAGTFGTHGAILTKWNTLGNVSGPVGRPLSNEAQTARVDGRFSRFEGGNIYFNPRVNGTFLIYGGILNHYINLGFSNHPLGLPTSDRQTNPQRGNEYQVFDGGVINQYGGNAYETHGAILDKWNALGGVNGPVGLPISDEGQTARVDGRFSRFEGGNIYYNPRVNGAFLIYGGILNHYINLGFSNHPLGLPVTDRQPGARGGDHVYQVFDGGVINQYSGNAYETHGAILDKWNALGGSTGPVGLPTSDEGQTARVDGRYETFEGGNIIYNPRVDGAFHVFGGILNKYAQLGYSNHPLGLPVSDREYNAAKGNEYQVFDGGVINQYGGNAYETHGAILDRWNAAGGANGSLGLPTSDEQYTSRSPQGTLGRYSRFEHGVINYNPKLNKAFVLFGSIGQKYAEAGYASSYLGLPTSEEFNYQGGKRQNFEGGYIVYKAGQGARTDRELAGGGNGGNGGKNDYVIRAIGDSFTAGFGLNSGLADGLLCLDRLPTTYCDYPFGSWSSFAAKKLGNGPLKGRRVDYSNAAVSGATTGDWLDGSNPRGEVQDFPQRLDGVLSARPDLVLMSLGGNDILSNENQSCGVDQACVSSVLPGMRSRLAALFRRLLIRAKTRVYVLLYPAIRGDTINAVGQMNEAIKAAARDVGNRVKYIRPPSFSGHDCGDSGKGSWRLGWDRNPHLNWACIHANGAGNVAIAQAAVETIKRFGL